MADERPDLPQAEVAQVPSLPQHLARLVGALHGPADLGVNHDAYLAYAAPEEGAGGAASA